MVARWWWKYDFWSISVSDLKEVKVCINGTFSGTNVPTAAHVKEGHMYYRRYCKVKKGFRLSVRRIPSKRLHTYITFGKPAFSWLKAIALMFDIKYFKNIYTWSTLKLTNIVADIVYELFVVVPCSKSDCVSKYASADLEKLAIFKRKLEISCPRCLLWHIQRPSAHDFMSPFTMNKKSLVHFQYRISNAWLIYRYNVHEKYFIAFR
jgi:hypothetical protein